MIGKNHIPMAGYRYLSDREPKGAWDNSYQLSRPSDFLNGQNVTGGIALGGDDLAMFSFGLSGFSSTQLVREKHTIDTQAQDSRLMYGHAGSSWFKDAVRTVFHAFGARRRYLVPKTRRRYPAEDRGQGGSSSLVCARDGVSRCLTYPSSIQIWKGFRTLCHVLDARMECFLRMRVLITDICFLCFLSCHMLAAFTQWRAYLPISLC